jgi:serine/threonine protein kinase
MIAARGHNRAVDFWAIGVFLFELLNRSTPFEQNDTVSLLSKIISLFLGRSLSKNYSLRGNFERLF